MNLLNHQGSRPSPRAIAPSVVLNAVVPLVVYLLVRPHVGSDLTALAIGAVIPVAGTLLLSLVRRRVDLIGVVAVMAFGLALLVAFLSGGDPLVLKLHDAVITGPLGIVLLGSVAIRKPLHLVIFRIVARRNPKFAHVVQGPHAFRSSMVITSLAGGMMAVHALVILLLAVAMPTATFLAVSRPIGWAVLGAGFAGILWWRKRLRARTGTRPGWSPDTTW
jgi:hypothetical protein